MKRLLTLLALLALAVCSPAAPPEPLSAASELQVMHLLEQTRQTKSLSAEEVESFKLHAAQRLGEIGTRASFDALVELAGETPQATVEEMGCRAPFQRPMHPYPARARAAMLEIRRREFRDVYTTEILRGGYLLVNLHSDEISRNASPLGAMDAAMSLPQDARAGLIASLEATGEKLSASQEMALAAAWLAEGKAPNAAAMQRLSPAAAFWLVCEHASFNPSEREKLIAAARQHPAVSSLAAVIDGRDIGLPIAEYLERDGANAVLVLSRQANPEVSAALGRALLDPPTEQVRRHAAAALMVQDTAESRAELRRMTQESSAPESLRLEVEGWLNQ